MGLEATLLTNSNSGEAPLILGLQASALVDHVARVDWSLLDQLPGERGGSIPVITSNSVSFMSSQTWVLSFMPVWS